MGNIKELCEGFANGKDAYAMIAAVSFNKSYEECLEFHPVTHEYQPEGKARRTESKSVLLGVLYGRSIPSIADQLYGKRDDMTDEQKQKAAQKVFDAVMGAFPGLKNLMVGSQDFARKHGYTETILGRRRHIPDMQLPEFEFKAMKGYVNPDIDPTDITTLENKDEIPERIVNELYKEFKKYKYYGQIAKRTKQLYEEEHIRVINNRPKINDATRQCVNCVDFDTEILTTAGFKRYDEISAHDTIISYNLARDCLEEDEIEAIHINDRDVEGYEFNSPELSCVCTDNHRWVIQNSLYEKPEIMTAKEYVQDCGCHFPILASAGSELSGSFGDYSQDEFGVLSYLLYYNATETTEDKVTWLTFTLSSKESKKSLNTLIQYLDNAEFDYQVNSLDMDPAVIEVKIVLNTFLFDVYASLIENKLTNEFVSSLSSEQALQMWWTFAYIENPDLKLDEDITIIFDSANDADVFQHLCYRAGHFSRCVPLKDMIDDVEELYIEDRIQKPSNSQYVVTTYQHNIVNMWDKRFVKRTTLHGCWCVTTNNGTWVARRHGSVFLTGNSIIQGSAAELTKMAILKLENNKEWQRIGGRLLVPIHDELLTEVPARYAEEGAKILSDSMCGAADFMPFPITCDVETTYRWYGMEYPCPYKKPESIDTYDEDEIKWIQYHLREAEYLLPVLKDENGEKPRGDAAKGVNGIRTPEMESAIDDYIKARHILRDDFIDAIDKEVDLGG